jgi:predicted ArsR family transcriptional regulator
MLTAAGRAACDQAYDDLALAALRFMSHEFGPHAVEAFASERAEQLAAGVLTNGAEAVSPQDVATALTAAGYAAEVQPLGDVAVQLCQHHCPVVDAAREFPILCEAETAALSRVLGRHVTRLATLAHGDEVCTAVIPTDFTASTHVGANGRIPA